MNDLNYKAEIASMLQMILQDIKRENGYKIDVKSVNFERIKRDHRSYKPEDTPIIQIVDVYKRYDHEYTRSRSFWNVALDLILRPSKSEDYSQEDIWAFEISVRRALMEDPKIGLGRYNAQIKLLDEISNLTINDPILSSTMGIEISYHEQLRR